MADDNKKLEGEFILGESKPETPLTPQGAHPNEPQHNIAPEPAAKSEPEEKPDIQTPAELQTTTANDDDSGHTHRHFSLATQKIGMHRKPHFYSSLAYYPEGMGFENQEEDEEIILIVRRDFITNLPWILTAIILAILPIIITPFIPVIAPFVQFSDTTITLYLMFFYLALLGYVIVNFTLWYFHLGIVTNKHIIDIDVHGILSRDVSRTLLKNVEDVKYTQVGVIRSIFNYGDVLIQTAGTNVNFEFDKAPEPSLIIQIIEDLLGKRKP